jgi:isopenicillin N synthase-like dioxygenase
VHTIPCLDLSGTFGVGAAADARRLVVAAQLDEAARTIGFFSIVHHGIAPDIIASMQRITAQYFDLSASEKSAVVMDAAYPCQSTIGE